MLAASLRAVGVEAVIVDEAVEPDAWPSMAAALDHRPAPLFVGFGAKTPGFSRVIELSERVRRQRPTVPVWIGGIHVTALPERSLEEAHAEVAVIGEAEYTVRDLVASARGERPLDEVPGILFRQAGAIRRTAERDTIRDLDALPRPAWDLIGGFERYSKNPWQVLRRGSRIAPLVTTRGCPFECTFCAVETITGRTLRRRNPEALVEELRWLKRDFGVDELHVIDDVFNVNLKHAKAVCAAIARAGLSTPFKTPNGLRADYVDAELVELMRRAGCWQVGFGVESGDEQVLDQTRKRLDLGALENAVHLFHRAGISVFGYFILGLPGDTTRRALNSLRYMRRIPFDHVHVSYCIPYPGTQIFRSMGGATTFGGDWRSYAHHRPFATSRLSSRSLRWLMRFALAAFYVRPRHAWQLAIDALRGGITPFMRIGFKYIGVTT